MAQSSELMKNIFFCVKSYHYEMVQAKVLSLSLSLSVSPSVKVLLSDLKVILETLTIQV